jgi:hypothetical protein
LEVEVASTRTWSLILAIVLIATCWLGNALSSDPHLLAPFPGSLGLLAFPVVLFLAFRRARNLAGVNTAVPALRYLGWSIVWPACLLLAAFLTVLCAVQFQRTAPLFLAAVFLGTAAFSLLVGAICAYLLALALGSREVVAETGSSSERPGQAGAV